jgi:GxxExxY protein
VIYQRALAEGLPAHDLEYSGVVWIDVHYKEKRLGTKRVDFFVGDSTGDVLLEIKAKRALDHVGFVQTLSYLKAANYEIGLLINFGTKPLEIRRVAN